MIGFAALMKRELRLVWMERSGGAIAILFFLVVASLFPFAVGPQPQVLARIGGGIVWISALLASLLSLDRLFQPEVEDGSLDQILAAGVSLEVLVSAKILTHWLTTALPLVVLAPLSAILLNVESEQFERLLIGVLLGTPALSAIGAIAAALTVGLRRGGILISLLVLPLAVPTLIFGVGALDLLAASAAFKWLCATTLLALAVSPFAAAAGLRTMLE